MRRNERGFVLVSVIWIAGFLIAVASTFAIAVTLHVKSEANLIGSTRAELAADGLVRLIAYDIADFSVSGDARTLPFDGRPVRCRSSDVDAVIAVQDQGGLIDLNRGSLALLKALFEATADPGGKALALAEAVADFRDSDDIRLGATAAGSESALWLNAPPPKNAPFQSVEEIEQVTPAEMADLDRLKPMLTVYSLQDGIDIDAAPTGLKSLLRLDRGGERSNIPFAPSQHKAFSIDAEAIGADGSRFRRYAIISLLHDE